MKTKQNEKIKSENNLLKNKISELRSSYSNIDPARNGPHINSSNSNTQNAGPLSLNTHLHTVTDVKMRK